MERSRGNLVQSLGFVILAAGVLLLIGNLTGIYRTFSFAGLVTMAVGQLVAYAGSQLSDNADPAHRHALDKQRQPGKSTVLCTECGMLLSRLERDAGLCIRCENRLT